MTYAVFRSGTEAMMHSAEHKRMRWWPLDELAVARLPAGYRRSIDTARRRMVDAPVSKSGPL